MTIKWGGIQFTGPHNLDSCAMPNESGLYSIMIKPDPDNKPNTYTVVYFGESENFQDRLTSSHHKYDCWKKQVGSDNAIYFGLYVMSNSSEETRRELEAQLIQKIRTTCND